MLQIIGLSFAACFTVTSFLYSDPLLSNTFSVLGIICALVVLPKNPKTFP